MTQRDLRTESSKSKSLTQRDLRTESSKSKSLTQRDLRTESSKSKSLTDILINEKKQQIKKNIICHIVGLDDFSKKIVITNFIDSSQINIIDIDKLNEALFNENKKLDELDKEISCLQNKKKKLNNNEKEKLKFYKTKLNKLWKELFIFNFEEILITVKKKILLIGNSNLYNNIRTFCNLPSKLKYITKLDYDNYTKNIISTNLQKYTEDIINGDFPLEYLSKEFLIKKRKQFENVYETKSYSIQTIDQIIFTIKSNLTKYNNLNIPINLYYASIDLCKNKIYPDKGINLIAYSDDAMALLTILQKSILVDNELKIHPDDIKILSNTVYLYKISSNNFVKYNGIKSKMYITSIYGKIIKSYRIPDILKALVNRGYSITYIDV
jgi:hypothetical protein